MLDGEVARTTGKAGKFGGILDSSLDRYGDGAIFLGAALFYAASGESLHALLASSALVGSFSISYIRARSECVIPKCRVGFWERGERIVYVAVGLLTGSLGTVMLVLSVGTHWTAFQRLYFSSLESGETKRNSFAKWILRPPGRRTEPKYIFKAAALILFALFFRI